MPIATLDPYKIAPIGCAAVFAIAELSINGPNAEYVSKARDAYIEAANTINDWMSFETTSSKEHEEEKLKIQLPDIYIMALQLMYRIHFALDNLSVASRAGQFKAKAVALVKNDPEVWEKQMKDLKTLAETLTRMRKRISERAATNKEVAAALMWIKKNDDPEDALSKIEKDITSGGRSKNYAQWFLHTLEYQTWFEAFSHQFSDDAQPGESHPARVLWISGFFGMGKSTILHRIFLSLKALESMQVLEEPIRVIHYFCPTGGTQRPDTETVVRSLIWKLSWKLDRSIAPLAYEFYKNSTTGPEVKLSIEVWQDLLDKVIDDCGESAKIVILVDALDAFTEPEEWANFLEIMETIAQDHPNVFFVFSSRQVVKVGIYFASPALVKYSVEPRDTEHDMKIFVDREIDCAGLRLSAESKSIFFEEDQRALRDEMRELLVKHAKGM
ncbi:uncharacterized protein J4E78_010995 [Alternaria triticimaculans]|uniref:uncharacterized protein n=1 Tax=Alternaria triticimaculans TaxID=297637 RepID=UPI0020C55B1F|nr:uncharacterized protein J4E78_010995 [Alternaria triticimaculans]KAI4639135.1 hypothetical protein J4E78_010995 [Alternaria triticimaculans]